MPLFPPATDDFDYTGAGAVVVRVGVISKILLFFRNSVRYKFFCFGSLTQCSLCYYEVDKQSVLLELHVTRWEYKQYLEKKSVDVNLKWINNCSFVKPVLGDIH